MEKKKAANKKKTVACCFVSGEISLDLFSISNQFYLF